MTMLRAIVGFTFFHLAFWLRSQDQGAVWFAAVVGVSALASMVGNAMAPKVRTHVREEIDAASSPAGRVAAAGLGVAVLGGPIGAVVLAGVLNLVAALGRLSFESIVQRDAPGANQGRAFAVFETRFQLAWAVGAFLAVAIRVDGPDRLPDRRLVVRGDDASTSRATPRTGASGSLAGHAGEPEAGRLDLVRRRHAPKPGEQRLEPVLAGPVDHALHEVPCRGRSARCPAGCRAAARRRCRPGDVSARRRRAASAICSALPPMMRTDTASTTQSMTPIVTATAASSSGSMSICSCERTAPSRTSGSPNACCIAAIGSLWSISSDVNLSVIADGSGRNAPT